MSKKWSKKDSFPQACVPSHKLPVKTCQAEAADILRWALWPLYYAKSRRLLAHRARQAAFHTPRWRKTDIRLRLKNKKCFYLGRTDVKVTSKPRTEILANFAETLIYVAKKKLQRFAEVATFPNVFHMSYEESLQGHVLKGKWNEEFFKNHHPIVLELGCGKGEYTVGLAQRYPHKNFIGVDIKGNRIWMGAKQALDNKMQNVAFMRTRIDFIESVFDKNEVSEIWITFPDPQPQKTRARKRLTSLQFLNRYKNILVPGGLIHLKTDSYPLYEYTLEVIRENSYELLEHTDDLYGKRDIRHFGDDLGEAGAIKTYYEKKFSDLGYKINYVRFKIG